MNLILTLSIETDFNLDKSVLNRLDFNLDKSFFNRLDFNLDKSVFNRLDFDLDRLDDRLAAITDITFEYMDNLVLRYSNLYFLEV